MIAYSTSINRIKPNAATASSGFRVKDPGSALTHFIGFVLAIAATPFLLIVAASRGMNTPGMIALAVFMLSMIALYGASTSYHTFDVNPRVNKVLKKIDHTMIFVLIAGTYTPICAITLWQGAGPLMLALVWGIALAGFIFKLFWVTCPKWVSSVLYIAMGWVCLFALPQIVAGLGMTGFLWLLTGGILYTVGGVIYALKFRVFGGKYPNFGSHELFHCFVLAGSFCHFMTMITGVIG